MKPEVEVEPHRIGPGAVLWAIPGLAQQFRPRFFDGSEGRQVPTRCVLAVRCVCGARTERPRGNARFVECAGDCGRWFLFGTHRAAAARFEKGAEDAA